MRDEETLENEEYERRNSGKTTRSSSEINGGDETGEDWENPRVEYEVAKSRLKTLQSGRRVSVAISLIFGIAIPIYIYFMVHTGYHIPDEVLAFLLFIFVMYPLVTAAIYLSYARKESSVQRKISEYETEYIQKETNNDIFESSIKMSYKYLDQYYLQTREQAQKGFVITVVISIFGAFLIAIGIVAMFLGKTDPSYVTCGSGVITEFISAIFFYLYNRTILSMSNYHNKLVLSHNVSIALKVSDSLSSEDKTKAKNNIINELLKDINIHLISSDSNTKNNYNDQE